jgi:hypothetical protein
MASNWGGFATFAMSTKFVKWAKPRWGGRGGQDDVSFAFVSSSYLTVSIRRDCIEVGIEYDKMCFFEV